MVFFKKKKECCTENMNPKDVKAQHEDLTL